MHCEMQRSRGEEVLLIYPCSRAEKYLNSPLGALDDAMLSAEFAYTVPNLDASCHSQPHYLTENRSTGI